MWSDGRDAGRTVGLRPRRAVDHHLREHLRRLSTDKLRCASTALAAYTRALPGVGAPRAARHSAGSAEDRPSRLVLHDVEPRETLIRGLQRQLDAVPPEWAPELAKAVIAVIDDEVSRRTRPARPVKAIWGRLRGLPHTGAAVRSVTATASPSS